MVEGTAGNTGLLVIMFICCLNMSGVPLNPESSMLAISPALSSSFLKVVS